MKPGLRESFKGFWSRPNRFNAWKWAFKAFQREARMATETSIEKRYFMRYSYKAASKCRQIREKSHYARNQTKEL